MGKYELLINDSFGKNIVDSTTGIVKAASNAAQACYNVPKEFFDEATDNKLLIRDESIVTDRNSIQGAPYVLNNGVVLEFGLGAKTLLPNTCLNNPQIVIYHGDDGGKCHLYKSVYKTLKSKNGNNEYDWFLELYDRAFIGNRIIFQVNVSKKKIIIDVAFCGVKNVEFDDVMTTENDNSLTEEKYNIIYYGVPGVGKSYEIDNHKSEFEKIERTVFHPDYTNSDFVGQLLPVKKPNEPISYEFVAGPFTRILSEALEHQDKKYLLVIEEINRGNASAIFGEIFQLLDRVNGQSKYCISNNDIANEINKRLGGDESTNKYYDKCATLIDSYKNSGKEIVFLPNNLYIWATMNTSDQNVFTLDTAFQRRWSMEMMTINYESADPKVINQWETTIDGSNNLKWIDFVKKINSIIENKKTSMISTEDKRLGTFFATEEEIKNKKLFIQKVIKYLWDDAFKLEKFDKQIFDIDNYPSLDKIVMDGNKEDVNIEQFFVKGFFGNDENTISDENNVNGQ